MKKITYILLVFALVLFTLSCNNNEDTPIIVDGLNNSAKSEVILRINKNLFGDINSNRKNSLATGDPFTINSVKKEDDLLKVNLSYGGGCKNHTFEIIWDGVIYKEEPCFINLLIIHNGNGDFCEAYITETITINLKQLIGDTEYKDKCKYNIFSSFNTSETPDVFVKGN